MDQFSVTADFVRLTNYYIIIIIIIIIVIIIVDPWQRTADHPTVSVTNPSPLRVLLHWRTNFIAASHQRRPAQSRY